ncbi:MAG: hypothetical protein MK106_13885 [Mariniblastus sp.]|nr:hypothetical protein [Mariniblastus sp.]
MIISEKTGGLTHWTRFMAALLVLALFPIGLVYAQDYEAIQKRLGDSVRSGEITRAQAGAMLRALRQTDSDEKPQTRDAEMEYSKREYMAAAERIETMVKEGKVSKEDAEKRLGQMRERMFPSKDGARDSRRAKGRTNADKEMEYSKREYMAAAEKIETMVKEGKVSKEDAEKRLGQMRERMFPSKDGAKKGKREKGQTKTDTAMEAKKREYMATVEKFEALVTEGKISKEDADERLGRLRMRMFPIQEGAKKSKLRKGSTKPEAKMKDEDVMEAKKLRYMKFAERVEKELKDKKITSEQAEEKLIEMRMRLFEHDGK